MTIDTNELRRLAQAATPGPWYVTGKLTRYVEALIDGGLIQEVAACGPTKADGGYGPQQEANARLIAAANPAAISEILDRLEAAEKERDALRARIEAMEKQKPVGCVETLFDDYVIIVNNFDRTASVYLSPGAQPAPSALAEAIIADMQAQHDSELITENDSGEALIRLDGAIAAVEDNFALAQPAPSVPEGWKPIPEKHPTFDLVDLKLADGSVLCGCVPQSDGDYWWEGPSGEVFIDPKYAPATHWRIAAAPEATP